VAPSTEVVFLPIGDPMVDARDRLSLLCAPEHVAALELRPVGIAPLVVRDGEAVGRWSYELGRVALRPLGSSADIASAEAVDALQRFVAAELGGVAPLHGEKAPRGHAMLDGDVAART
jgi:hypothetical protein